MKIIGLTVPMLLALLCESLGAEEPFMLVENGRPRATIVIPRDANDGERKAAEELQTYVRKASEAVLPIQSDGSDLRGLRILLGRAEAPTQNLPSGDGFLIDVRGDRVVITGGNARGTLYGVYDLLEDQLGVRWFMPGEIGEVVPKSKTIVLNAVRRREQPSFEYRWIGPGNDWSARTRNNVGLPQIGINIFRSAHTFRVFLDPEKYFDKHPDWFAEVGGVRRKYPSSTHNNQICTSNAAAVEEVIKNIRQFLDEHPETDIVTLFPNDGNAFCECDACKALDEPGWASVEESISTVKPPV